MICIQHLVAWLVVYFWDAYVNFVTMYLFNKFVAFISENQGQNDPNLMTLDGNHLYSERNDSSMRHNTK